MYHILNWPRNRPKQLAWKKECQLNKAVLKMMPNERGICEWKDTVWFNRNRSISAANTGNGKVEKPGDGQPHANVKQIGANWAGHGHVAETLSRDNHTARRGNPVWICLQNLVIRSGIEVPAASTVRPTICIWWGQKNQIQQNTSVGMPRVKPMTLAHQTIK